MYSITLPLELTNILRYFSILLYIKLVRQVSVMNILCSISTIKELPRTIKNIVWQQVNILAIHVTELSVWFFKPFVMYPFSLLELGSDNTAYLDLLIYNFIFNLLWSIVKRSKELSKLQCFWDLHIISQVSVKRNFFFLSYTAIAADYLFI